MIIGLVGVNGAGKTTYLRHLYGQSNKKISAFLPDAPVIPIEVTALELLQRTGVMRGLNKRDALARAEALCSKLLIDGASDRAIATYSAGNYKKTALAVTLMTTPVVLYLDEPLETVDAISRFQAMKIFRSLADTDTTIYLSTQDLDIAQQCDVVKVFANREIVAQGTPAAILGQRPYEQLMTLSQIDIDQGDLEWIA